MRLTGIPYRLAFYLWRHAPARARGRVSESASLQRVKNRLRDLLARAGDRDDIYNATYYALVDSMARQSAPAVSQMIVDQFRPKSAVDLGCGTGAILLALRDHGVRVMGLEYSRVAVETCVRRNLDVRVHDIEADPEIADLGRFDVAICMEVAEHVKPQFADTLIRQLISLTDRIVFTAATPGQGGGVDHVNEQPNAYWISKFRAAGYRYLEHDTATRRRQLAEGGAAGFYASNLMLFKRHR